MTDNGKPKYFSLMEQLRSDIMSGAIRPGEKLPSENELSQKYSLSNKYLFREMPLHIRPAPGFPALYELYVYSGNISVIARFLKEASLPVG